MRRYSVLMLLIILSNQITYSFDKAFFYEPLSAGLPTLLKKYNLKADQIFLIIHESDLKFNFHSKESILSLIKKYQEKEPFLGHLQLAWSCKFQGRLHQSAIGFNSNIEKRIKESLMNGQGLESFLTLDESYYLESPQIIEKSMEDSLQKKRLKIIPINPKGKCNEVLTNIWNFINQKKFFSLATIEGSNENSYNCTSSLVFILRPLEDIYKKLIDSYVKVSFPVVGKKVGFFMPGIVAEKFIE